MAKTFKRAGQWKAQEAQEEAQGSPCVSAYWEAPGWEQLYQKGT